jgi:hypothetical protein
MHGLLLNIREDPSPTRDGERGCQQVGSFRLARS